MNLFVELYCFPTSAVLFVGPLIPLFWILGDVCSWFQRQGESFAYMLPCLNALDSSDSSLVWHLLTSWWPALHRSLFLPCANTHTKNYFLHESIGEVRLLFPIRRKEEWRSCPEPHLCLDGQPWVGLTMGVVCQCGHVANQVDRRLLVITEWCYSLSRTAFLYPVVCSVVCVMAW